MHSEITSIAPQLKPSGLIKPRGENQIQYLHNILTHDSFDGLDAGNRENFLPNRSGGSPEALERQKFVAFVDSSCGGSRRKLVSCPVI